MSGMSSPSSSSASFAPLSDMSISVQFRNGRPSPTLIQAVRSTLSRLSWRIRKVIEASHQQSPTGHDCWCYRLQPNRRPSYPRGCCEDANQHSVFRPKFEPTFERNHAYCSVKPVKIWLGSDDSYFRLP